MAFSPRFFEFEGKGRLLVVNQTLFKNLPIRAAAVRETGFASDGPKYNREVNAN